MSTQSQASLDAAVEVMQASTGELLEALGESPALAADVVEAVLDNAAMLLDMAGMPELGAQCLARQTALSGRDVPAAEVFELARWLCELSDSLAEQSLEGEDDTADVNCLAPVDLPQQSPTLFIEASAESTLSEPHQRTLQDLWQEIESLQTEFDELLLGLPESADDYARMLRDLGESCSYLGLHGLQDMMDLLADRVPHHSQGHEQAPIAMLGLWQANLRPYLMDGAPETACLKLLDYLEDSRWSESLAPARSQHLLRALMSPELPEEELGEQTPQVLCEVDVALDVSDEVSLEVMEAFLQDAPAQTRSLHQALSQLVSGAGEGSELVRQAQRASHTLKGSANLLGLKGVANLSHALEAVFDEWDEQGLRPSPALQDLLMEASDCVSAMVDYLLGRDELPVNRLVVLQALTNWREIQDGIEPEATVDAAHLADDEPAADLVKESAQALEVINPEAVHAPVPVVVGEDDDSAYEKLLVLTEEMSINNVQARELHKRLQLTSGGISDQDRRLSQRRTELEMLVTGRSQARPQRNESIDEHGLDPLEMDRYDELHRSTHQYFEVVADVCELNRKLQSQLLQMDALVRQQHRHIDQLQHTLLARQRVPVSTLTGRLQRCVRQASRMTGKHASLVIEGETLKVDRELLEQLAGPLMHLLRNAVDHGIESAERRLEAGKTLEGRVEIVFEQTGRFLDVRVQDDGGGLDLAAIQSRAEARGLLPAGHGRASPEQLAQLLWLPGFSSREEVTQVSGRGIGLDAVKYTAELLGGSARCELEENTCAWQLRIPVKEITQYMLLVEAGGRTFALPTASIRQALPTAQGLLREMSGQWLLSVGNELCPYYSLAKVLYGEAVDQVPDETQPVLLLELGDKLVAVGAERLLTGEQLVARSPGKLAPQLFGLLGLTILGDGSMVPILNLNELLTASADRSGMAERGRSRMAAPSSGPQIRRQRILVVDDSLSVRSTLKQLLQDMGFEVETASDGVDAMEKQRVAPAHLMLVDMEMPRMDGLELTRHIRQQPTGNDLPIVMLTSRSQEKHRQLAQKVGVSAYATKPYDENALIDTIQRFLR
ncbi:MAG: hypothetical protein CME36_15840 [unclassified Hahellaceae]|nr:hypothetical protein [Hahellaceae bacterium]|tara:strand:- start:6470 stop:9667 length:3198 start_codon:yes stop_codon:yes gene_type:complete